MTTLERNFQEGIPQQWELFDTEKRDFFEDQNIETSEKVQNILENNEQTTPKPIDSVQQATRQKVNSILSGVQEFSMEEFSMEEFPMTIDRHHITYLHSAKNIGEKEATINFRHDNKELYFSVTFKRKEYRDHQYGSLYALA